MAKDTTSVFTGQTQTISDREGERQREILTSAPWKNEEYRIGMHIIQNSHSILNFNVNLSQLQEKQFISLQYYHVSFIHWTYLLYLLYKMSSVNAAPESWLKLIQKNAIAFQFH